MIKKWVNSGVALWVALLSRDVVFLLSWDVFFAFSGCICFFHPAALSCAFTNGNTMVWLLCKRLVDRNGWGVSRSCWSLLLHTPARSVLVCVLCSALGCWRRDWYWHYTSDPCWSWESSGGGVEAVPRFHREELVVRNGGERFPPHVCISTCTAQFTFPKRVTSVVWSLCCAEHGRGSSAGMGAAPSPLSPHCFVTLSWQTAWAATPAGLLSPDLCEQLKAWFTHPHPECELCTPSNLSWCL